jgi:hypothetical protein
MFPITLNQNTGSIALLASTSSRAGRNLCWCPRIARRDIKNRVTIEEVARTKEQCHRLSGHDGIVLGRGEVSKAECMPEDNVCVVNGAVGACRFNPRGQTLRRFAGSLRNVAARGVNFVVGVWNVVRNSSTWSKGFLRYAYI